LEKEHVEGKCLFEPTTFTAPMVEQWLHSMWNEGERGTRPEWGWIVLGGPNGKRLQFSVQLTEFSSTMGEMRPYFEFGLRGLTVEGE
jgi:hypothetical protein